MLTVKHIGLHGSESLYQAYEVSFEPHPDAAKTLTRSPIEADHAGGTVTLTKPPMNQGELGRYMLGLVEGTVFVMNETGKTVARYDLGQPNYAVSQTDQIANNLARDAVGLIRTGASIVD